VVPQYRPLRDLRGRRPRVYSVTLKWLDLPWSEDLPGATFKAHPIWSAAKMPDSNDLFSFVVVGAMNPSIHHPAWYRLNGIFTEEEAGATDSSGMLVTSQISQFSVGSVTIVCDQARWQVQTRDETKLDRLREIAAKTFEVLFHTPVSLYGLNFAYHRVTTSPDVKSVLATLIRALPLGLGSEPAEKSSAKINYQSTSMGRVLTTLVEPSVKGEEQLFVAINAEYRTPTPAPGEYKPFDLTPLLNEAFHRDYPEAKRIVAKVVDALNALKEA
jgi:hypothetical protein